MAEDIDEIPRIPRRPTREAYYGNVDNPRTFDEAYDFIQNAPDGTEYQTNAGNIFYAVARITVRGPHMGERVIVFKQNNREMARAYPNCWGHITNCNGTYIDSYTPVI